MKIYVGNLSFDTTDTSLRSAFAAHGEVSTADVIIDRETGRSRGFGFVEMPAEMQAKAAIAALNGQSLQGRQVNVNEARERPAGGGGGGDRRGGQGSSNQRW